MAYDIYGNNLQRGHCEVHPYVHEEYPCSVCYSENQRNQQQKEQQEEMERAYGEELARLERDYYMGIEFKQEHGVPLV